MNLKDALTCSICYDLVKDPLAVRSCLHKFCFKCIEHQHKEMKQCPHCRMAIGCKRHLKADNRFRQLIKLLVPDIDAFNEYEAQQRDLQLKATFDFKKFRENIQLGLERQLIAKKTFSETKPTAEIVC